MRPISIKLEQETIDALDEEAEDRDLTRSQYLRRIIDARHEREERDEHDERDLAERVQRIEERLDQQEQPATREQEPEPEPKEEPERDIEPIEHDDVIEQTVDAAAESWDDSPERREARKAAACAALAAIREQPMSKSEILDEVEPRHPVDGQSKRTWWRKNLSESNPSPLKQLATYSNSTKKWEWTGK